MALLINDYPDLNSKVVLITGAATGLGQAVAVGSGVKIIKRGDGLNNLQASRDEKTARQSEREIVSTIKGWVAELEQRRGAGGIRTFTFFGRAASIRENHHE